MDPHVQLAPATWWYKRSNTNLKIGIQEEQPVEGPQLEHVCFKLKHQGSKRCPALLRRARSGSVRSTGIAVNEKTWSDSVKDGHALIVTDLFWLRV